MKRILIVTQQADNFSKLAKGLSAEKICDVIWANSVEAARSAAFGLMDLIIIPAEPGFSARTQSGGRHEGVDKQWAIHDRLVVKRQS